MSNIQMRLNAQDPRFFSPDRDLAYCTPHLIHRALKGLDPNNQEHWIASYLKEKGLTNDDLVSGAFVIAKYMNNTLLDPTYNTPFAALVAAGFFDLPQAVQTILLAKIGQVFMSAFFTSIRDVTRNPNEPNADIKAIAEQAEQLNKDITRYKNMSVWMRWLTKLYAFLHKPNKKK